MYVYKITNKINNKVYIGITKDIARRFSYHRRDRTSESCKEYSKPLYAAMRKYGIDHFEFVVLHSELTLVDANALEIPLIKKYASLTHQHGYNIREGGDLSGITSRGENHYNAKLTESDVVAIIKDRDVVGLRPIHTYRKYAHKIAYATFEHIWLGRAWEHLQPSIIVLHKHEANKGEESTRSKLSDADATDIIHRRDTGTELQKTIYAGYINKISFSGFFDVWSGRTWKHLQPSVVSKQRHGRAYLTDDQVQAIKHLVLTTRQTYKSLGTQFGVPASTISNIINNKTYKHIT